jgi:hypothetical protein
VNHIKILFACTKTIAIHLHWLIGFGGRAEASVKKFSGRDVSVSNDVYKYTY